MTQKMNLQRGLVGHWTFDSVDTEGSINLSDSSAYDNDCSFVGSPTTGSTGIIGEAYTLDGVDDEGTITLSPSLTISGAVSVAGWIKTPNSNSPSDGNAMPFHECQDSSNRG